MKKRKYNHTRKLKAVVRTVIAAALLLLAVGANFYGLLPSNGLRILEESYGTGKTEIITKTFEKAVFSEIYLTENENVLMLAASRFSILGGWCDLGAAVADKDPDAEASIEAGFWYVGNSDSGERIFYIFGKITDDAVTTVTARIADADRTVFQSAGTDEFTEKDGSRYFIIKMTEFSEVAVHGVIVEGFDQNSLLIYESEVDQGTWTGTSFSWLSDS